MAIKKYSVKASAEAKAVVASKGEYISAAQFSDTLKSAKKKFNEKFKKGPYACAEVQGMGYIYYNDGSKIYVPNVLRSYDDALAQVKKLNTGAAGKVAASKSFKKTVKASSSAKRRIGKESVKASELLGGIDKLPERGKVITKTINGDPTVIVGIDDNKYMYKSYLNKASASGDVQFIRNLIKKGEVPANAVKNLGYKLYTASDDVESACGKKSVKAGRYSDAVPYENRKYWYFTTHGIGPGTLPKDVNILDTQEGQNRKGTWGDYLLLDAVLNTDELREYDLIELAPLDEEPTIKPYKNKNTISVFDSCGKKSVKSSKSVKSFGVKASKSVNAARNSKTVVELVLQGNYGYGWDDLVSYDNTPEGRKEMKDDLRTYQQEERGRATFRTIERRVANPDYKAPADRFRVTPYKLGFKYKDGDTVKFADMEEAIEYAVSQDKDVVLKDVVTGYKTQISNDTSFGLSGQDRDNFNERNIRNFRQVVGESETVESSVSAKKQFGVKASKSAKKRVSAAKGYWADDLNAENNRKILQTLRDAIADKYDSCEIGAICIVVYDVQSGVRVGNYSFEVEFVNVDTTDDISLYVASSPESRGKLVCVLTEYGLSEPYGKDISAQDTFTIPMSGSKNALSQKIEEIAEELSTGSVEGACGKKRTVKASAAAKKRKAIKASGIQDDIVMYFNGDNVYQGSVYDLADAVENLCYDDEVNAKFQEWCNQFGDPFDFDGSPIDTARVFTDIIIQEAEEAPETENGGSQFYEDGNGILDFEIFYANEGIYSAKSIKCWDNGNDVWEYQESYDYYYDEEPPAHIAKELERLAKLTDKYTDRWFEKFEELHPGERYTSVDPHPDVDEAVGYTLDDAEYRPDGIKASTDIKADTWESSEENINDMLNDSYEYDGFDDSDMLEYVDSFLQDASSGAWLSTDHVVYNGPDDWEVSAGLSPEAVESDFWFFLDDVDHELYEEMLEAEIANPLDEDPINYTYNQNAINGNEFYIQLYPNNNQIYAPQIDFDEEYLTPEWLERLTEIRKAYEDSRIAAYTEFQNSLGSFLANGITASTEVNAELQLSRNKWDRKKYNWSDYKNSITDIDGYVKDLADGVVERFSNLTYDISDEAITFTDETGAVVYIQPIDEIVPEKDDLDNDITELGDAIQHANEEADWFSQEQVWDDWDDDPDYATRAVELSRDINCAEETVDIDDLEYITGDTSAEDRIFDVIIDKLRASELSEFGEVDILGGDADIKIYPDGADIDYIIAFIADPIAIGLEDRFMKYVKHPNYNDLNSTQQINGLTTEIIVHNGVIRAVNYVDLDDYDLSNYDIPAYEKYVEQLARPVVEEIYNFIDQAVYDGNITSSTNITANADDMSDDWGYGFDSNGDPVDESTVEELERIAQEILDKSEIHSIDEYADLHNFNYYASIPYIQESFNIAFTYVADIYELSERGLLTEDGIFTTVAPYNIRFNVRCKNGEVEYAECTGVDVKDNYVKDVELKNFNLDALVQFATDLVNPVAKDIYYGTTNI